MPKPQSKNKSYRNTSGRFVSKPKSRFNLARLDPRKLFSRFPRIKRKSPILFFIIILFLLLLVYIFKDLPSPTRLTSSDVPLSTQVLDRNGQLLYNVYAEENRVPIKLTDLPSFVKESTIAIEDKDFYRHHGLAFTGIARAVLKNIRLPFCKLLNRNCTLSLQGGSTITQQLVKNGLLTQERTLRRKIRELTLTLVVEIIYSKDQILEMYLNQVPYGGTSYGIESAAQTYFGKKAKDLTLSEASLLAGLPQSPTRYSPFGAHPELAKDRQKLVLERMLEDGYIDEQQKSQALEQSLSYAPPQVGIRAPHFVLYVKDLLVQKYGEAAVEKGGLKVTTSLDLALQDSAQEIVASEVAKLKKAKVGNSAALVINPQTGEILSMVGSHNYFDKENDGNVNVTLRHRQPGSSIKPLNYALAIENNTLTAASVLLDTPTCFGVAGQRSYCPENYDRTFHGAVQIRFALGNSYNIPAVKTLALNGLENFINKAREFGITTFIDPKNYGLSLTLGGGEVRMIDMAQAFAAFANTGYKVDLHPILKVEDAKGKILEEYSIPASPEDACPDTCPQVISPETAYIISHILLDNNARSAAFGPSSFLNVSGHPEVSVKTGTTNDKRDNWTIGYNPDRVVAVWVGNNDNTPLGAVASGITGASPIWNRIMRQSLLDLKPHWPIQPENVVGRTVCSVSGLLPPDPANPASCFNGLFRYEYFKKDNQPTDTENLRRDIPIDKTTGIPSTPQTPPENVEMQNHAVVFDVFGKMFCLDCVTNSSESAYLQSTELIRVTPTPKPEQ